MRPLPVPGHELRDGLERDPGVGRGRTVRLEGVHQRRGRDVRA
jgi:hypothetical protein